MIDFSARPISRALLLLLISALSACQATLRTRGVTLGGPRQPVFEEIAPAPREYRVWVLVPELVVRRYPQSDRSQQPLLQFTGDRDKLDRGWGQMTQLVAPDEFQDGDTVTFFEDRVLWSDALSAQDSRSFTLWLRENNRTEQTRLDTQLAQVTHVAGLLEDIVQLGGIQVAPRQVVHVTRELYKELQQDWLIVEWICPWRHLLDAARPKLAGGQREVALRARVLTPDSVAGQPVAELSVVFVVQRMDQQLLPGSAGGSMPVVDMSKIPNLAAGSVKSGS